jgi:hypothetical protein
LAQLLRFVDQGTGNGILLDLLGASIDIAYFRFPGKALRPRIQHMAISANGFFVTWNWTVFLMNGSLDYRWAKGDQREEKRPSPDRMPWELKRHRHFT